MFLIVAPIFLVILVGYGYGRLKPDSHGADKLINDYVLYVALPALLFVAVAGAGRGELRQWGFMLSTLAGIAAVYGLALGMAGRMGIGLPQASILGMGACYGTTGYLGVPILIAVYGPQAAWPAALATILHNIPAIMAVVIRCEVFASRPGAGAGREPLLRSLGSALLIPLKNPLTLSVLAGLAFVLFGLRVPASIDTFARFLGNAAGPTALFALGLGLSRLNLKAHLNATAARIVLPMIALKLFVQPAITWAVAVHLLGMSAAQGPWLAAAVVMAAQPVGAGGDVFARKYGDQQGQEMISLAISVSLLFALVTIPVVLSLFPAA
ncbi:MAG: AEC family transporter [Comamonas sp.]